MSDLYDDAVRVPRYLWADRVSGRRALAAARDLHERGYTNSALVWRRHKGRIRRPYRGAYLGGAAPPGLVDRLAALRLVIPAEAVCGFHTAATLHGFGVIDSDRVHILVPPGTNVPSIRGVAAHQSVLPFGEPVKVLGIPCVAAARCAVDLARTLRRREALPVLDAALRAGCVDLVDEVARHDGLRGVRQAREPVRFADGRAECRQESELRLILRDARLPVPEPQVDVGRYRVDLGYRDERLGLEYDGSSHLDRRRMRADRGRHNWLEGAGWAMRYFTDHDLYRDPTGIVETVRAALATRRSRRK